MLLLSDPALPSLVGMIVDEPLRSSWWGHPRGPIIYETMSRLDDDERVLSTKLVARQSDVRPPAAVARAPGAGHRA